MKDVHETTAAFKDLLAGNKTMLQILQSKVNKTSFVRCIEQVELTARAMKSIDGSVYVGLNNIVNNFNIRDPDLFKINCSRIMIETWMKIVKFSDVSVTRLFMETLSDINNTCVAGITHRLLYIYIML
jgi:hypothetical protein